MIHTTNVQLNAFGSLDGHHSAQTLSLKVFKNVHNESAQVKVFLSLQNGNSQVAQNLFFQFKICAAQIAWKRSRRTRKRV